MNVLIMGHSRGLGRGFCKHHLQQGHTGTVVQRIASRLPQCRHTQSPGIDFALGYLAVDKYVDQ